MGYDRNYIFWALVYVICGMSLSCVMASAEHHVHYVTPTHVILVGLVLALVYGVIHRLWLVLPHTFNAHPFYPHLFNPLPSVIQVMLHIHRAGALTMFTALLLMYGEVFLSEQIDPALAAAYITVLVGSQSMLYMVRNMAAGRRN